MHTPTLYYTTPYVLSIRYAFIKLCYVDLVCIWCNVPFRKGTYNNIDCITTRIHVYCNTSVRYVSKIFYHIYVSVRSLVDNIMLSYFLCTCYDVCNTSRWLLVILPISSVPFLLYLLYTRKYYTCKISTVPYTNI